MNPLPRRRRNLFAVFLLLWGGLVVGRLAQLQLAQGAKYRAKAQKQQERRIEISPRRGSILDREGRDLAVSVEVASVFASPEDVSDPAGEARALAPLLGMPEKALLTRLRSDRPFVWLQRKIDVATADRIRERKLPGIQLVAETRRYYPKGTLAASVLGYVGVDDTGLSGLEYSYDKSIRGKPVSVISLRDARRFSYGETDNAAVRRDQEGATLTLSIDSGVQFAAENELIATVAELHAKSGSVVLMDPWTGAIVAMASAPGFDPNQYSKYPPDTRRNRAVADAYEPGSTFKIVTGSAALDAGVIGVNDVIDTGHGVVKIGRITINEDKGHDYGALTLAGILEHSSNVGIIRVGLRLGARGLYEGASRFGIGQPTGVDVPGENTGIFRPLSRWSFLSNASISMGQEVSLTAIQLARVAAVIANGGMLVSPRVVTRVSRPDGREEVKEPPAPVRVISEATANAMRDMLVGVVERGTGTEASIPGFTVGGKTGTAQKAGFGGYERGKHVPNFVGFAPADHPRLVGVVVVEEPQGNKYYAAQVTAPLFSRIMSRALGILRVAPEDQRLPSTMLASLPVRYPDGLVPASSRREVAVPPAPKAEAAGGGVPDASGLSARQALALFARIGIPVKLQGTGFVTSQTPAAGTALRPGEVPVLTLSESAPSVARAGTGREETSSSPFRP